MNKEQKDKIFKMQSRWYEFWKPRERIVVICFHDWENIEKVSYGWFGAVSGYHLLFKCIKCGNFKKVDTDRYG